MQKLKKTLFTLNLHPAEYKEITDITYPFLKHYAGKCGADMVVINKRRFPKWPANYEKFQIYKIGQEMQNDWNIFFDCDALIHPDTPDWTEHIPKDTVAHNGADMSTMRFRCDRFLRRDGRHLGSATWLCIASDWCIELFEPCLDMTPAEVDRMIFPTSREMICGMKPIRLVEDFLMSRNIAKYGLKFVSLKELQKTLGLTDASFFFHMYAIPKEEKVAKLKEVVKAWGF